jgi:hypothetical protein
MSGWISIRTGLPDDHRNVDIWVEPFDAGDPQITPARRLADACRAHGVWYRSDQTDLRGNNVPLAGYLAKARQVAKLRLAGRKKLAGEVTRRNAK